MAVAFNSLDTMLAPFIAKDGLNKKEVKQELQDFIFGINSNSRMGSEPAFSNVTLDITPSKDMMTKHAIIGGMPIEETYGDFQKEMDLFNECFTEIMIGGDNKSEPFAYPVITYNIGERFDWDNPKNDAIFEMAGKFGYPYFSNYINSDMQEGDLRSLCCRLRLDLTELRKRNGGLFGSGDSTGSIGVVTINLPRIAYESGGDIDIFYCILHKYMQIAKRSLELKRVFVRDHILSTGMIEAYETYVGTMDNHFSTIGVLGMNEMCENFLGCEFGIDTEKGEKFAYEVGEAILETLVEFQQETGHLYNYEATPAEGTCYRLAKIDKEKLGDEIITRGTVDSPYYTNSCHIPVNKIKNVNTTYRKQERLQKQFTGGTVIHNYLDGEISGEKAKHIVKTLLTKYGVPYTSLSPLNRYCPEHGYVSERVTRCPKCGAELKLYQRVTGYLRPVENFNIGKAQEFKERVQLDGKEQ